MWTTEWTQKRSITQSCGELISFLIKYLQNLFFKIFQILRCFHPSPRVFVCYHHHPTTNNSTPHLIFVLGNVSKKVYNSQNHCLMFKLILEPGNNSWWNNLTSNISALDHITWASFQYINICTKYRCPQEMSICCGR